MENSYTELCKTSFVSRFFLGITHLPEIVVSTQAPDSAHRCGISEDEEAGDGFPQLLSGVNYCGSLHSGVCDSGLLL